MPTTAVILWVACLIVATLFSISLNNIFKEYQKTILVNKLNCIAISLCMGIVIVSIIAITGLNNLMLMFTLFFIFIFGYFLVFYIAKIELLLLNTVITSLLFTTFYSVSLFLYIVTVKPLIGSYAQYESIITALMTLTLTAVAARLFTLFYQYKLKQLIPAPIISDLAHVIYTSVWGLCVNLFIMFNLSSYQLITRKLSLFTTLFLTPIIFLLGFALITFFTILVSALYRKKIQLSNMLELVEDNTMFTSTIKSAYIATYEVNCTRNSMQDSSIKNISHFLGNGSISGLNYDELMKLMSENVVYPDDANLFLNFAMCENILKEAEEGKRELILDYRQKNFANGFYEWVRATTRIVTDEKTKEVSAVTFLLSIHKEKIYQMELKFKAERDLLTHAYNKITAQSLISSHIAPGANDGKKTTGSLFIIDIDNFKDVNDTFGHTYGDDVLCEVTEVLREVFRENDIIGRIGGDEFIVFVKGLDSDDGLKRIASKLCSLLRISYKNHNSDPINISASIGIAKYPEHGLTFSQLSHNADIALYQSKNHGKDSFTIYSGQKFTGYKSSRTQIEQTTKQKPSQTNRIEHVFKIIYDAPQMEAGLYKALELATNAFDFDRGYICKVAGENITMEFEWLKDGMVPIKPFMDASRVSSFGALETLIRKNYAIISKDAISIFGKGHPLVATIKSFAAFAIIEEGNIVALIGFDNCRSDKTLESDEAFELTSIAQLIGLFYEKYRNKYVLKSTEKTLYELISLLDDLNFVVDRETKELLYVDPNFVEKAKLKAGIGAKCHKVFRNRESQCGDCPIYDFDNSISDRIQKDIYYDALGYHVSIMAEKITWNHNPNACIILSKPSPFSKLKK